MLPVYVSVALLRCGPRLHLCPCCGRPRSSAVLRHGVGGAGALAQLQLGRGGHSVLVTGILSEVWTASGVLFESPPTVAATALLGPHLRPPSLPLHP